MAAKTFRTCFLSSLFVIFSGASVSSFAATKVQAGGLQYQIDKTPAWVTAVPSPTVVPASAQGGGSTQVLLADSQINLLGAKPVAYIHERSVAQERSGLEGISTIRIPFNPRYETLTLHELAVYRDGKRMDRLKTARIDLAQRERRLEEGVYDEDVEAIVALADVRVGDHVEYAYSVSGENPIFAGKYSGFFILNREQPVARLAVRIQYPAGRKLNYRLYRSETSVSETLDRGVRTLRLDAQDLAPVRPEQTVPPWFGMYPWLQVTEYESWDEVGAWAKGLYGIPTDLNPEIEAVLDQLRSQARSQDELAALTLAWVQNEIRYYSIAVGSSSHRPNHPNVTVRQRFGDCKDKSLLLSAMLQRLGIRAEPALVSYRTHSRVGEVLPTHQAFDHVIVRVQIGDLTYWLDGTRTYQGRALDNLGFMPFGKALVVGATPGSGLANVVAPARVRSGSEVIETFKVSKYGDPTTMVLEHKFHGYFAEWFRNQAASDGPRRIVEMLQSDYAKDFPNLGLSGEATVADDPVKNVVTLTQTFTIPQLFSYEDGYAKLQSLYARSFIPWLRFPGSPDRKFPLALPFPDSFEHSVILELPSKVPGAVPPPENWQDRHLALSRKVRIDGTRVTFDYGARFLRDHIAAADVPGFSEKFKPASAILFSSLSMPTVENAQLRARLLRDFERAPVNFRNPDQADRLYQKFLRSYAVADESIRGGLIAGPLLARAYKDRAEAASSLGRRDEALADVAKSIELDPNDSAYVLQAEIQLYAGRYQEALDSLGRLAQESNKSNALTDSGMANFYLGNYAKAQLDFAKAAEVAGSDELPYTLIWLAVAAKKAGNESDGTTRKYLSRLSGGWPAEAVTFMLGDSGQEALIAAAKREENESRLRLCEAYFYLGQKALLDGNPGDAKRWFGKSVDTKVVMYREHIFSQQELKRLERH